jgi:hypothetical protein
VQKTELEMDVIDWKELAEMEAREAKGNCLKLNEKTTPDRPGYGQNVFLYVRIRKFFFSELEESLLQSVFCICTT